MPEPDPPIRKIVVASPEAVYARTLQNLLILDDERDVLPEEVLIRMSAEGIQVCVIEVDGSRRDGILMTPLMHDLDGVADMPTRTLRDLDAEE